MTVMGQPGRPAGAASRACKSVSHATVDEVETNDTGCEWLRPPAH
jgi:hypothetical protein